MVRDGIYYALGFTAAGAFVSWLLGPWTALPFFILGAFFAWFFRDPERLAPAGPVAVSPGDGRVVAIVAEGEHQTRISIFLNVFDVHVNRSPISGIITDVTYQRGKFLVASLAAASSDNEQNVVTVRASDGTTVVFKQIAGLLARRIVFNKKVGDFVQAGERVGLIKFGSRVDVILGPEWRVEVAPGMHVSAGSTVLARRPGEIELPIALAAGIEDAALCQT
ncbi:MAG TPA: phosphatidylserine decarboxylase [Bryobacteraceae bacterium]|jgi:phosphatidylserine decarboxylase|nr:phosphatidylserine decarboxylase [Bryobacteraceae bacterium]